MRTKEARAHRHPYCLQLHAHLPSLCFFFLTSCRCIVTLICSNLRSNRYVRGLFFFENAAYRCHHSSSELKWLKKSANDYTAGVDFFPSVRERLSKSFTLFRCLCLLSRSCICVCLRTQPLAQGLTRSIFYNSVCLCRVGVV